MATSSSFMQVNVTLPWTPHIRVSSTNDLPPSQIVLSSQASHTLLGSAVDLVKLDLFLMHLPLFTLEGEKSSYSIDPFHTMRDFIPTHGPFTPFIHLLDDIRKN